MNDLLKWLAVLILCTLLPYACAEQDARWDEPVFLDEGTTR